MKTNREHNELLDTCQSCQGSGMGSCSEEKCAECCGSGESWRSMSESELVEFNKSSEPKDDPKEKELYSIKPLDWWFEDDVYCAEEMNFYYKVWYAADEWFYKLPDTARYFGCKSKEEAQQKCADHFTSKLKLCLNREL